MIGNELPFAGLVVSAKGVSRNPERTRALTEFPRPIDVTGVHNCLASCRTLRIWPWHWEGTPGKMLRLSGSMIIRKNLWKWRICWQVIYDRHPLQSKPSRHHAHWCFTSLWSRICHGPYDWWQVLTGYLWVLIPYSDATEVGMPSCSLCHFEMLVLFEENRVIHGRHQSPTPGGCFQIGHFWISQSSPPEHSWEVGGIQHSREMSASKALSYCWCAVTYSSFWWPDDEDDQLAIDTARTCLTQVLEKNPELKMILDGLDADYTKFRREILEDTCISSYFNQKKSVCGQWSVYKQSLCM